MKKILSALLTGLIFSSCVPITPQSRIAANPQIYAALSPKERSLVSQGQIARGMSPTAVFLAWGNPSQRFEGSVNSKNTTRWDYIGSRPVYTTNFYGGYGHYGPYGHHGYSTFGVGPEIAYVPDRLASVWFVNNRVEAWERTR